ncbi:uncharacterized protein LOC124499083 [Dermatophagoides farinae]|uniref:uncharacterized protein LOC124499083 n=1 Tax=Dermatophagoides farinae TaxID=6954 RepID=UPI003F63A6FE
MSNYQWQQIFEKVSMGLCKSILKNSNTHYNHHNNNDDNNNNKSFVTRETELIYHDCLQDIYDETIPYYSKEIYCCQDNEYQLMMMAKQKQQQQQQQIENVYLHHEYCCTWSMLMIQYKNFFLFLALLILANGLIIAFSIIFNCYLIWISIGHSYGGHKYVGIDRNALRSKPRFPSFGNITEILRSKNPMVRLKLEFDVDNIETIFDWKQPNRNRNSPPPSPSPSPPPPPRKSSLPNIQSSSSLLSSSSE